MDNVVKDNIIKLTVIYFAAHWLMLVVTGYWCDDWCVYDLPLNDIINLFTESGSIFSVFPYIINGYLPPDGYKKILFFLYYINVLCLYRILRNWLKCGHNTCFWISALYATIPCNDARIMLILFGNGISLCCCMLGLCILSEMLFVRKFTILGRIITLLLFLYSFKLASLLTFYSLALLMIYTKEKNIKCVWKYFDYLILPIAFWAFKNICFPTHGAYEGYNAISAWGLIKAVQFMIPADVVMLINIVKNYALFALVPLVIVIIAYPHIKAETTITRFTGYEKAVLERRIIRLIFLGIWSLSMALFTYLVVRGSVTISTSDFQGRDSFVVSMGAAILLYLLVVGIFSNKYRKAVLVTMILSGICYFNFYYLAYQRDYYKNVGFQYQLAEHPEIKSLSTMICLDSTSEVLSMSRFYTWNMNARNVFGDQTRFIMNGKDDLMFLHDKRWLNIFIERPAYGMMQYSHEDNRVKCILAYKFTGSYFDTIHLMTYGRTQRVYDSMEKYSQLEIYYPGSDMYNSIITFESNNVR